MKQSKIMEEKSIESFEKVPRQLLYLHSRIDQFGVVSLCACPVLVLFLRHLVLVPLTEQIIKSLQDHLGMAVLRLHKNPVHSLLPNYKNFFST